MSKDIKKNVKDVDNLGTLLLATSILIWNRKNMDIFLNECIFNNDNHTIGQIFGGKA